MLSQFLFYTMLAFLFTHELDAIKRHVWRILPLTSFLPERLGEQVFIWLHVPIFIAIFWFALSDSDSDFGLFLPALQLHTLGFTGCSGSTPPMNSKMLARGL
jgi:hypothetical protein